ncbi:hypothetical protein LSCM1_04824 [Leishmania martiniquensis]|uniref:Exocyst complex component EXOC2/Sec5 N-terminal domain-containing protein n=1 Tax=Leishmania martiniquensis TaxID=1580590 RepID=A0A836GJQ1_9TRYP|nr:hypothetical protein LSCM1_04824 [Leishmania martiniquensis]
MEEGLFVESGHHRHPQLDLASRAFQPKKYIQRVLANVSHAAFDGQLVDKVRAAEEDTGEALKQLIRDNLGVFIDSKDAMDAVYNSDAKLFTGEALEGIASSFKSASTSCESLVQPITETFLEVQKSRKTQDMLDKFFTLLSVPAAIYDSCGAKVAHRRQTAATIEAVDDSASSSADDHAALREGCADKDRGPSRRGGQVKEASRQAAEKATPDEDDDGSSEEDSEIKSGSNENDSPTATDTAKAHGTLESPADRTAAEDAYILEDGEEIYFWYGTPLVRLKDVGARRHHVDQVSNYEAAVLHLRRAMLYLEETYSLIDGAMLVGDDGEPPRTTQASSAAGESGTPVTGQGVPSAAAVGAATAESSKKVSAVGRSVFAYKFAMALLRASLYLCSQLAEELIYANPADTVLIEDTLSMMMDASIASVKLHHFCAVLQEALGQRDRHDQVLSKLRTQLCSGMSTAEGVGPKGGSTAAAATAAHSSLRTASSMGVLDENSFNVWPDATVPEADAGDATSATAARRATTAYQHPAEFLISIVQRQQKYLFYSSAAGLLREASRWLWKAQVDAARGMKERNWQQELQRKLCSTAAGEANVGEGIAAGLLGGDGIYGRRLSSAPVLSSSDGGDGGFIGNANDSFLREGSFSWINARPGGGRRQSSAGAPLSGDGQDAALAPGSSTTARSGGSPTDENRKSACAIPDSYMSRVLDAFNTPESPFPTEIELRVGTADMDTVLVSSCLQIRAHSTSLLNQLFTRAEIESAVMAQAGALNSFALRLCAECVGTLEHVVGSYWGGIAITLHSGVFDFAPEPESSLHAILTQLLGSTATLATAGTRDAGADGAGDGLQRSPSTILAGTHSRLQSRVGETDDNADFSENAAAVMGTANRDTTVKDVHERAAGLGIECGSVEQLPRIRFVPTLPHAFHAAAVDAAEASATQQPPPPKRLRDISVQAVHRMIGTATATLQALFVTFINRSVTDGFVSTLEEYRVSDLSRYSRSERIELHAAVLYEIILGQWERMMHLVSDAVLRLKIVIGESSSSATITSETQVEEVGDLLQELERLRSTSLRCYLHGIGVLSKAYLTALPLLQRHTDTSLDARVRSRLSRESVSSSAVHKLLNLLAVVMDRCVPFFARDTEVYDSVDLFAVKSENLRDDADEEATARRKSGAGARARDGAARRRRLLRQRVGDHPSRGDGLRGDSGAERHGPEAASPAPAALADGAETVVDPVSERIAKSHSALVVESLQDHEELVLALLSHLLLTFMDMLQLKCRTVTTDATLHPGERERCVVECMADTLCLATTMTPIVVEHLLAPCFFEVMVRQLPEVNAVPVDAAAMLQGKQEQYRQVFLLVVEEHCQLAVDAMMSAYLALAQQPITDLVRRQGFVQPLFDWQRVSPHTTAAVRPYIADAIVCIARAHETLNAIRQPILGSAATQRLVAHLVRSFLTSFTSDVNVFELSVECSSNFLVYGLTLLEAEAATILRVVDAVVAHATANPNKNALLPELAAAREHLDSATHSLEDYANSICEALAAAHASEGGFAAGSGIALTLLSRDKRHERRDGMVQAAMRTLGYMLEAINTELEESSLSSAALLQLRNAAAAAPKGGRAPDTDLRSAVAERIVQRIERRREGYELRRARAAAAAEGVLQRHGTEGKRMAEQPRQPGSASASEDLLENGNDASGVSDKGANTDSQRQMMRRRSGALALPTTSVSLGDADGGEHLTPRTMQESERESWTAAEAVSNVFQLAQDQQRKGRVRRVRKSNATDSGGAESAKAVEVNAGSANSKPTPAATGDTEEAEAVLTRDRVSRRSRRRLLSGDGGSEAQERHERRANRFRRINAL